MSTAISVIHKAMYLMGAKSQVQSPDPNSVRILLEVLVEIIERWDSLNTNLGITLPTVTTDELGEPPWSTQAIYYTLCVDGAPLLRKTVTLDVLSKQNEFYADLLAVANPHPLPDYPDILPIGTGNMRGPKSRVFYSPNTNLQETETGGSQLLDDSP